MSMFRWIYFVLIIALFANCSVVSAPQGTVPSRKELQTDAFGAWFSGKQGTQKILVQGELVAIDGDSLFILMRDTLRAMLTSDFDTARIIVYNTEAKTYGIWTGILTGVSLLTGYYAALTLPLSLGIGITTYLDEKNRIHSFDHPPHGWPEISKYARFPQGMPPGLDKRTLRSKWK